MTGRYHFALGCFGFLLACASSRGTVSDAEPSTRFRDLTAVVIADSGEAMPIPGMGYIRYPDEERRRNIEAAFAIAFLLDTDGRAEYETVSFLGGAAPAFFAEACHWLRTMRFAPVRRDGTPQRSLVVIDLTFTLDHSNAPGSALLVRRVTRVNVEKHRRRLAALGVVQSARELELRRHCL